MSPNKIFTSGYQWRPTSRDLRIMVGLIAALALSLAAPHPAAAQTTCTETSVAITGIDPAHLTSPFADLVSDCTTLLGLKDELRGSVSLNWSVDVAMDTWDGVTVRSVGGTPSRVTILDLTNKQLTGTLPTALGNLTGLKWLYLGRNQLTGNIPSELGNLSNLEWLYLNNNQLTGPIPPELNRLTTLTRLNLSKNQLEGAIPGLSALTRLLGRVIR